MSTMSRDDRNKAIVTARDWLAQDPVFLDTETTGLGDDAQLVEVAVVDGGGRVLFDQLVRPTIPIPPAATAVHGITDEMVASAPFFGDVAPLLWQVIARQRVVIYNAEYDLKVVRETRRANGLAASIGWPASCAMLLYARFWGDWNFERGDYRWQKLAAAAGQCGVAGWQTRGFAPTLPQHRALGDAQVCRLVVLHVAAQKIEGE